MFDDDVAGDVVVVVVVVGEYGGVDFVVAAVEIIFDYLFHLNETVLFLYLSFDIYAIENKHLIDYYYYQ